MSCLADPSLEAPHVAYAIGRRAGNAVRRNRLRRQLRQIMAHREASLRPAWYLVGVTSTDQLSSWTALSEAASVVLETVHRRLDHAGSGVAK